MKKNSQEENNQQLQCIGFPSPADDYMENRLDLNQLLVKRPASTFFVRTTKDNMRDAGIFPGDILVVDKSLTATNGKIVVAILHGEFIIMRYETRKKLGEDFQVWGVVTYVIHKPE